MKDNKFYNSWENITDFEKSGIETLNIAKQKILEVIPNDEIISIYIKGSFPRRETNKNSDIDMVTILKTADYFSDIKKLDEWGKVSELKPYPQFVSYSLLELKTGKREKKDVKSNSPNRFSRHLDSHELIYGKELKKDELFVRTDKEYLNSMINAFENWFIPDYKENNFSFGMLVKQTFWLVENEQSALGKDIANSWKNLRDSIVDENHIIYDAWELRINPNKDKKVRKKYISKLEKYLEGLK